MYAEVGCEKQERGKWWQLARSQEIAKRKMLGLEEEDCYIVAAENIWLPSVLIFLLGMMKDV